MDTRAGIEFIVRTYELSPERSKSLIARAIEQAKAQVVSSFESLYSIVANLVEKVPFWQRLFLRRHSSELESLLSPSAELEEEPEPYCTEVFATATMRLEDALDVMKGRLSEPQMRLLRALSGAAGGKEMLLNASEEDIVARTPDIMQRLEKIEGALGPLRTLVLPAKKLFTVQFNPVVSIRLGKRDFGGNPLAFFQQNRAVYEGMNLREFQYADGGLSNSLREHDQLGAAFPNLRPNLTPDQHASVVSSHAPSGGKTAVAARQHNIAPVTVYRHWKKDGLVPNSKNVRPTSHDIGMINAAVVTYGTISEAARHLPKWNRATITKHLSPETKSTARNGGLGPDLVQAIVDAHPTYGGNPSMTATELGVSRPTVLKYWGQHNLAATGGRPQ